MNRRPAPDFFSQRPDVAAGLLRSLGAAMVVSGLLACGGDGSTEPEPTPTSVAAVSVSPTTATLVPDQTLEVSATPRDAEGNALPGRSVTWATEPTQVATVDGVGVVTARGPGTATVRATSEGRVGTVALTVVDGGWVEAAGGVVAAADGAVVITVPAGALGTATGLTVLPLTNPPAHPQLITGTGYELGPNGTSFASPVTVQIAYDDGSLGAVDESHLVLHRWSGTAWEALENGMIDTNTNTVSGETSQFSPFAAIEVVPNPVPTIASLDPESAEEGGAAFTLTITGTGFVADSEVHWNAEARTTTFVSPTVLTAQVTANDIAAVAEALVTVVSPLPGGGTSEPVAFSVLPGPAVFLVSNTADAGPQSLRQAMIDANANPGPDLIHFDIPGGGPHSIQPSTTLPDVTEAVTIDGLTQPGAHCSPWPPALLIEIDGSLAGFGDEGFSLEASDITLRGLVINGFRNSPVQIRGGDRITFECNFIGTDVTGTVARGSGSASHGINIVVGSGHVVGGTVLSARNLISGNTGNGINVFGPVAGLVVQGNLIGTDVTGQAVLGNGDSGINLGGSGAHMIGGADRDPGVCNHACNLISGNGERGINVFGSTETSVAIEGNFIGTDLDGVNALGNFDEGVRLRSPDNSVGGTAPNAGNLIAGNGTGGIRILGAGASGTTVQGNLIGADVTGLLPLPNGGAGVKLEDDVEGTIIGGDEQGARNIISGNTGAGIHLDLAGTANRIEGNFVGTDVTGSADVANEGDGIIVVGTTGTIIGGPGAGAGNVVSANGDDGIDFAGAVETIVRGNIIGTDPTGTIDLGNADAGMNIFNSFNNQIGGTVEGAGNVIAFNRNARDRAGIRLSGTSTGNAILGNAIYGNVWLGIDLAGDGVTPNDAGDADEGQNRRQNVPDLTSAITDGARSLTVTYVVDTAPANATYPIRVEFFVADTDGQEGRTFLGADSYPVGDAQSERQAVVVAPVDVPAGTLILATATDADGNTSEFSATVAAVASGGSP